MADEISRRQFLGRIWWGITGILVVETGVAALASVWPSLAAGSFGTKLEIGTVEGIRAIPVGTVVAYKEARFFLSHVESGFLALYRRCTHLGCVVPWLPDERSEDGLTSTGRFNCPCHGSIFDRYGVVHGGPAPRPMDIFPIIVEQGKVLVDTGIIVQRSVFNASQAASI